MARARLTTDRVVSEAARIADAEGLDAVTIARVAEALAVRPPSLYNHVDGLDDLLQRLSVLGVTELSEVMRDAAVGHSGATALRRVAWAYRSYALAHPGRYAATVRAPEPDQEALGAAAARAVEVIVAVLGAWDFEGPELLHRVRALRACLHGFVGIETGRGFQIDLDRDTSFERMLDTMIAGFDSSR